MQNMYYKNKLTGSPILIANNILQPCIAKIHMLPSFTPWHNPMASKQDPNSSEMGILQILVIQVYWLLIKVYAELIRNLYITTFSDSIR